MDEDFQAKTVAFTHVAGLTWRVILYQSGAITDIFEADDADRLADMVLGHICPNEFKIDLNHARRLRRQALV